MFQRNVYVSRAAAVIFTHELNNISVKTNLTVNKIIPDMKILREVNRE